MFDTQPRIYQKMGKWHQWQKTTLSYTDVHLNNNKSSTHHIADIFNNFYFTVTLYSTALRCWLWDEWSSNHTEEKNIRKRKCPQDSKSVFLLLLYLFKMKNSNLLSIASVCSRGDKRRQVFFVQSHLDQLYNSQIAGDDDSDIMLYLFI